MGFGADHEGGRVLVVSGTISAETAAWLRQARDGARAVEADPDLPSGLRFTARTFANDADEFLQRLR